MESREETLRQLIRQIPQRDEAAAALAQQRWDLAAKPVDGLGAFEKMIVKIAALTGTPEVRLAKKAAVIFCGDHGVVEEGVTQTDASVTALVASNIARGCSTVNHMAAAAGAAVFAVDVGMAAEKSSLDPGVADCRIRNGTANLSRGPAMKREEACGAILAGIRTAEELKQQGFALVAAGEMGIGNTTSAAALTCALTGRSVEEITGRGAGLSDQGLARKKEAIRRALDLNRPDPSDPLDLLAKVGGLEIAGLTGLYLGCALYRIPVILDVSVTCAAAVLAKALHPRVIDAMLPSNMGKEPSSRHLMELLGLSPVIHADMALGEATGALMLMPLLDMTLSLYHGSRSFADMEMTPYQRFDARTGSEKEAVHGQRREPPA